MTTLQALRIYGPINHFALAERVGRPVAEVVDDLCDTLQPQGLATFDRAACTWDCTEEGRLLFEAQLMARRADKTAAAFAARRPALGWFGRRA